MEFLSSLTIFNSDTPLLLEKRILLIKYIDEVGSISKAAKKVPMSYKAAWDAIDTINNLCPTPVIEKSTGGVGGGGAKVTPYGKNLIQTYITLQKEHAKFLTQLTKMTDFNTGALKSLERFSMQISARNKIQGVVERIENDKVNSSVYVKLKSGFTLMSIITNGAVKNLDLKVGDDVVAIFKSSSVLLTSDEDLKISASNQLKGKITNMNIGEINTEIILDIGNTDKIVSIITKGSQESLNLQVGNSVSAIIKASNVMIGK